MQPLQQIQRTHRYCTDGNQPTNAHLQLQLKLWISVEQNPSPLPNEYSYSVLTITRTSNMESNGMHMEIYNAGWPTVTQFTSVSTHTRAHTLKQRQPACFSPQIPICHFITLQFLSCCYANPAQRSVLSGKVMSQKEQWSGEQEVQQGHAEFLRGCFCMIKLCSLIYSITLLFGHRSHPLLLF